MDPDDLLSQQLAAVLANAQAPWYLRARRRVAFFVGRDLGLVQLGYLVDYDRDRYADLELSCSEAVAWSGRHHLSAANRLAPERSPGVPPASGEVDA